MTDGGPEGDAPGSEAEPEERPTVAEPIAAAFVESHKADATSVEDPTGATAAGSKAIARGKRDTASEPGDATGAASRPGSSQTRGGLTTIGSPLDALRRDEILRTRRFCAVAQALVLAGGASVPLLPTAAPVPTVLVLVAVVLSTIGIAFLYRRTTDPSRFELASTKLGFLLPTISVTAAIPYFGAFSPAPVLLILAVYFMGFASSVRLAATVYAVCALGQLVTAALVIHGFTPDTGLITAGDLSTGQQWIVQGLIQAVILGAFVTARMSRRTTLLAVGELERAVRFAAHREALLLEAREELERALRAGRGRFTDQVIGGYQLGDVIGRGAMGEVYAATDGAGAQFAVKLLSHASLGNPQHVQRFLRELRTAAQIRSDNVVTVVEVGEQPVPYLVMERLEGKSLSDVLRGKRGLPPERVVDLVRQVGAGLTAAAKAGVIHRDIKPQNLFLQKGTWKILDFGVSRLAEHGDTLTSGQIVGTPAYMAPEQARGAAVDYRTDLYALAAVAYRALTGQPPYASGEVADTLYRVVHTAPRRPSSIILKLPTDVDLALAVGLAKLPGLRYGSADELVDALAAAATGRLPEAARERGRVLERGGAWATS